MKLIIATRNTHKLEEIRAILGDHQFELLDLDDVGGMPDELPETGSTFEENALQKARYVFEKTQRLCVADDSGIEVDALNGAPGIHSKRFSPEATDDANNAYLMAKLDGQPNRDARYRCVIAIVGPNGEVTTDGRCEGTIVSEPRGTGGFGYDPYFLPREVPGKTMAELTADEKNAISHRGRAFRELPELLAQMQ